MSQELLASSLRDLSDAIGQLAHLVEHQKDTDNEIHIKQFSVIVKRFKESSQILLEKHHLQDQSIPLKTIQSIHKKGFLANWLNDKNLITSGYIDNLQADAYLYKAVDYLTDYYQHLDPFYRQLKSQQCLKRNFTYKSKGKSLIYIQNWCKILQKLQLIDRYSIREDDSVYIDIAEMHAATSFIYGYWLEVLLRREIAQILYKNLDKIHSFDIISQANIIKPDDTVTEFDLLLMVNQKTFWFECKSGAINEYFEKFSAHRRLMGLNHNNSFLVIPDSNNSTAKQAKQRAGMTTLYGTELEKQLSEILF